MPHGQRRINAELEIKADGVLNWTVWLGSKLKQSNI